MSNSGNYTDYMEGVPVKISERYKPPPIITLPCGVIESATKCAETIESINYDFNVENNILEKLIEWQNIREAEKTEREHQLKLLEEARQKKLEKEAAENEEKLKQLSISEVSYPSTEEISEISPDDTEECKAASQTSVTEQIASKPETDIQSDVNLTYANCMPNVYLGNQYVDKSQPDVISDILKPIPISPIKSSAPANLLDDPDPIKQFHHSNQIHKKLSYIRPSYMKNNLDHLTFSDFENDTSSPFDNMELKTINDLELLAQVLNPNQSSANQDNYFKQPSASEPSNDLITNHSYSNVHSTNIDSSKSTFPNNCHDIVPATLSYTYAPGLSDAENGFYQYNNSSMDASIAADSNYYHTKYAYIANSVFQQIPNESSYNPNGSETQTHNGQSEHHQNVNDCNDKYQIEDNTFKQTYEYYNMNYSSYPATTISSNPPSAITSIQDTEEKEDIPEGTKVIGSRSRSVPDIVRELDEELDEAQQRSHNCSPVPQGEPPEEQSSDAFTDLSESQQLLCKHISSMGFPLPMVARACDKIGGDDKKIIEYLLLLGQLMDLGFSESSVADALINNNCNRDKALDDLIS